MIDKTVIRSAPGRAALTSVKEIDRYVSRLTAAKCAGRIPSSQFLPVLIGLGDICDDSSQILEKAVSTFTLCKEDARNSPYYRAIMKRSAQGKRLRVCLHTTVGERLFEVFTSIDTLCCIVTMLTLDGKISQADAQRFYTGVNAVNTSLEQAQHHLRTVVNNVS